MAEEFPCRFDKDDVRAFTVGWPPGLADGDLEVDLFGSGRAPSVVWLNLSTKSFNDVFRLPIGLDNVGFVLVPLNGELSAGVGL